MDDNFSREISNMKLLVIDDDPNLLALMDYYLKNKYIVDKLNNSSSIFEKLDIYKPDLILMDIMMPDISGLEICRTMKNSDKYFHIPIILITAKTDENDVYEGLEAGAVDYIKKPFTELELIARINSALKNELYIRKLKMLNKLKDNFISMVSHDIKTPLTSIMGYSELLLEDRVGGSLSEKQRKIIKQILDSANHQSRIIKDLLNFSLLESGGIKLLINKHKLKNILAKSFSEISFVIDNKNINFIDLIDDEVTVRCDDDRLTQVFTNLISNAVKFTPVNGEISVGATLKDGYVEVFVKDSGVGIPGENINKIFDQYELFTTKGTGGEKGTGLGIGICNKIIKEHGGNLFVHSEEGVGTTFFFTLPM